MPDFRLIPTVSPPNTRWAAWVDPAVGSEPSRTNALEEIPHRYLRLEHGTTLELQCEVGGVLGELDANLGGRLFTWAWVDWPGYGAVSPPALTLTAGQSSRVQITTNLSDINQLGNYVIQALREDGGSVLFPFHVELTV